MTAPETALTNEIIYREACVAWRDNRLEDLPLMIESALRAAGFCIAGTVSELTHSEPMKQNLASMIECRLAAIESSLWRVEVSLALQELRMADAMDDILAKLSEEDDAVTAVSLAIDKLLELVKAAGNDPAKVQAVIAKIQAQKDAIAAAAMKGTQADQPPAT